MVDNVNNGYTEAWSERKCGLKSVPFKLTKDVEHFWLQHWKTVL